MNFGDVVYIEFPYSDSSGSKSRPAAVINTADFEANRPDLILLAITTQFDPNALRWGEIPIDWRLAGLTQESALKPNIMTVMQSQYLRPVGRLTPTDQAHLRTVIANCVQGCGVP